VRLASRSPPGLRRCRSVLPDEASIGSAPHMCANAFSLRSRSMFWPAVMSICAVWTMPTPRSANVLVAARLTNVDS
jgi:hypothetical protein